MTKNDKNIDSFILRDVYPDVETIFTFHLTSLESIKDSCIFVIDTNSLLIPYETGKNPLAKIKETYNKLITESRLLIPSTVAREFAKNRTNKILNLYKNIKDKHSNLRSKMKPLNFYTTPYPLLESFQEYQNTLELEKKIDKNNKELLKEYKKSVDGVLAKIKNWTWNDPVSKMYGELFKKDIFFDIEITDETKESLFQEMKKRYEHRIPPGYKDSTNESKGSGDFLIWKTILEIAKKHSNDLVFVSGDKKSDWFHRIDNEPLYPRYELVDEYRRNSSGKSFHIISFA
ncbi:MAG: DUF4935 domain-containing protein, partial [Candidatus Heimdallarchaeota archaeon]|nr:DUF4935 domain-containing protein [Candidatus Heimdallarchaeota archaeon]MCK4610351.1 DUF4935 domain-containing protein [Candidatus Heimdallarchaeota archaeon]